MMKKLILTLTLILLATTAQAKHVHKESWYVDKYCKGFKESHVYTYNWRIDCETSDTVYEYDFAVKRDEALGQVMRYAMVTGKKAGIVLIIEKETDKYYAEELIETIKYHGLKVMVETVGGRND